MHKILPSVADWLAVQGCEAQALANWLAHADVPQSARFAIDPGHTSPPSDIVAPEDAGDAWRMCVSAVSALLSADLAARARAIGAATHCLAQAPPGKGKAATLPHPKTGVPVVLCPYDGTPGMLVVLAHECGHAMHLGLGPSDPMPPSLLRETCACMAEHALIRALYAGPDQGLANQCAHRWNTALDHAAGPGRDHVLQALSDPYCPVTYAINYPPARLLAAQLCPADAPDTRDSLFTTARQFSDILDLVESLTF